MRAVVWSDYLCPWCYLGRDRTGLMRSLGVEVTALPFELHPELPLEGRRLSPRGRLAAVFDHIAAECEEVGLPFNRPDHVPNTRRALEAAELVRRHQPEAFEGLDQALFEAYFVQGRDIGDPGVIDQLVREATGNGALDRSGTERSEVAAAVDQSMAAAHDRGVTGTPAWLVDGRLLIPGVQPRDLVERWVRKLQESAGTN